jgi:hypothetical protein
MNRKRPYDFISNKLEQLNGPDTNALWQNMNQILETEMPDKERKRRGFFGKSFWSYFSVLYLTVFGLLVSYYVHHKNKQDKSDPVVATSQLKIHKELNEKESSNTFSNHKIKSTVNRKEPNSDISIRTDYSTENQTGLTRVNKQNVKALKVETHGNISETFKQTKLSDIKDNKPALNSNSPFNNSNKVISEKDPEIARIPINNNDNLPRHAELLAAYLNHEPFKFTYSEAVDHKRIVQNQTVVKIKGRKEKGFVFGVAFNYNLPVSRQEMSTVNMNGSRNILFDYLPSVYSQYHLSKKVYLQAEFQFINPQYTPNLLLAHHVTSLAPTKRVADSVSLNKLYYMNFPVSVHYSPFRNFYVGAGIQYSYLSRSILTNEQAVWEKGSTGWSKTSVTKSVEVKSNPVAEANKAKANSSNGGGGNPGNSVPMTAVDTAAQSFKSNDWRFLAEASYHWHRFNVGLRFNIGLDNYINTSTGGNNAQVKDRNKSFLLYLKYNFLDLRRKSPLKK